MSYGENMESKHCHDSSRTLEDREQEKKLARKRLYIVSAVCLVFMVGEILGGYFAGSLAVMTDAAHLLVDFTSFIISLCSLWLSSRPATQTLSYGWHRAGTPAGVDYREVKQKLLSIKGVKAVHNLHIWALTMNQAVLSAHVAIDDAVEPQLVLREMTQSCFTTYSFHSVTIQLEQQSDQRPDCNLCQDPKH